MEIKVHREVNIISPVMVAGWPGMGNVAINAVNYLRRKLGARLFAEIDVGGVYPPDSVIVSKGIASFPESPKNLFYYRKKPSVIFVEGQIQLSGERAAEFMNKVLDLAEELRVKRIFTGAAFPVPSGYRERSDVYVGSTSASLTNYFRQRGVKALSAGQISGLNGLMLGFAQSRGIEAACLLATLPQYAVNFPSPKASSAIVETICKVLGVKVDMTEIGKATKEMNQKMAAIEDKIKEMFPVLESGQAIDLGSDKTPNFVMEKIEKLFHEVKRDRKKATQLKKELDRWDLYKLYEDRFLDLFKEEQ